jgi:HPt (histidine-containing phosphotransfer) domain-containing protein
MSMNSPAPANTLDVVALNDLKGMLGDALTEIAESFLEGLDGDVAHIQSFGDDPVALGAAAHSLKGSAANMGARVLAGLASSIEKAAGDGDLAQCTELVRGLPEAADHARQALSAYIAQP